MNYIHTTRNTQKKKRKKNSVIKSNETKEYIKYENKQYDQQENWGFDNCHLLVECWLFLVDMCCCAFWNYRGKFHTRMKWNKKKSTESKWNKNQTISWKQWKKIVAKIVLLMKLFVRYKQVVYGGTFVLFQFFYFNVFFLFFRWMSVT